MEEEIWKDNLAFLLGVTILPPVCQVVMVPLNCMYFTGHVDY